ncbi:DNA mismatch repair protein MutT [Carbonactinospora thermoautotrophica]|uniref:DNA mismatch repair protein MutT n=1 Tax=Carbonactinospora thermoautotrophica TaxID=1469144 RepID=A0A132MYM0_9ACTN|nr:NUDIX domain-containing protein [Carbonactinospora thermoautotrophica]KWW98159.1 DNA mismatch repair protein MutT [Carbonactinospora thermoautotrophica]KWX02816.1 putative MutT family protein [Carbonactinospora thermoautotrophica]KWX09461.1 DNA mismatch repair protein MutT [Carbonactinospora thermoautotrophica]
MPDHVDALAWVCVRDGRLLAVRTRGKDIFYLPGGKREPGESDLEALTREIGEELAVRLLPETVTLLGRYVAPAHGYPAGTLVRMACYTGEQVGEPRPNREIAELAWLTARDRDRIAPAGRLVLDDLYRAGRVD